LGQSPTSAARGRKSDWGDNLGKIEIPLAATSRVPNAATLAYTKNAQCWSLARL